MPRGGVSVRLYGSNDWEAWVKVAESQPSDDATGQYELDVPGFVTTQYTRLWVRYADSSGAFLEPDAATELASQFASDSIPTTLDAVVEPAQGGFSASTDDLDEGAADTSVPPILSGVVSTPSGAKATGVVVVLRRGNAELEEIARGNTGTSGNFLLGLPEDSAGSNFELTFEQQGQILETAPGGPPRRWQVGAFPSPLAYTLAPPEQRDAEPGGTTISVSGLVTSTSGRPLPGIEPGRADMRVAAYWLRVSDTESQDGTYPPNVDGTYALSPKIPSSSVQHILAIRAEALLDAEWTVVAEKRITVAANAQVVDLVVDHPRLHNESAAESGSAIDDALSEASGDPETTTAEDEEVIADRTGEDPETVRCWLAARRLHDKFEALDPSLNIDVVVYCVLLQGGYPQAPREFARRVHGRVPTENVLRTAVTRRTLPSSYVEAATLIPLLDDLVSLADLFESSLLEDNSLAKLIRAASKTTRLSTTRVLEFVSKWLARTSDEAFWSQDLSAWAANEVTAVKRAMQILFVTDRHLTTIEDFQAQYDDEPASWLAEITLSGWMSLTGSMTSSELPSHIYGDTLTDRRNAWAQELNRRAEGRFRAAAARGAMVDELDGMTAPPTLGGGEPEPGAGLPRAVQGGQLGGG